MQIDNFKFVEKRMAKAVLFFHVYLNLKSHNQHSWHCPLGSCQIRASLEQFKEHIQINDVLCDWIENAPVDHVISKIDTKVINKKIIIIIAFCILIFICLSILSLEIRNWIIDTAFENLKVISN